MKDNVLITGVAGGMGRATAELFLGLGCNVIGFDVADSVDLPISYYKVDLTDASEIETAFFKIRGEIESIDAIIYFAGIYRMASLVEMDEESFKRIFDVNLFGIYRVNKIFLPLLKQGSKIIMTSSELAPLDPLPFTGIYAVTKSAIEKYAYSLRMELQLIGIKVALIRPGAVKTGLIDTSVRELDKLCEGTRLYSCNTKRFRRIVNSVESRQIDPARIAKVAKRIYRSADPKFVYSINRNPLLRLLNALPRRVQLFVIRKILK